MIYSCPCILRTYYKNDKYMYHINCKQIIILLYILYIVTRFFQLDTLEKNMNI